MLERKLSVDDILGEIELNRAKAEHKVPSGNMQRIDDVIREILTQKQEVELKKQNRVLTEKERASLEKEIEAQTRSLTKQFEKLKREKEKQKKVVGQEAAQKTAVPESQTEIHLNRVKASQQIKVKAEAAKDLTEADGHKKEKYEELKKIANNQHIRKQMNDITSHFGNFKMEDESVDEVYAKTELKVAEYKEFKNNRNKKIQNFTLDAGRKRQEPGEEPREPSPTDELTDEAAEKQLQAERRMQTQSFEYRYEYTAEAQADTVWADLNGIKRSIKTTLLALGALSLCAVLLSFVLVREGRLYLFGRLQVPVPVYAFAGLGILLVAVIASFSMFKNVADCIRKRIPAKDYFFLVTALLCLCINVVFCINPQALLVPGVHLFSPLAVLLLFADFLAKYQTIQKTINNFRFVSSEEEKYAVEQVEDTSVAKNITKGILDCDPVLVKNVRTEFFENFLSHSFKYDISDSMSLTAMLAAFPISLLLAVAGFIMTQNIYIALTLLCGGMILGCGMLSAVIVSFPLFDSADIVNRFAGMIPGYDSIEEYKDTNAILLDAVDLFPAQSVVLHGIKTFQGNRVDDAILDAASVVCAANSVLKHVFLTIINQKTDLLRPVSSVQYEDLMGISAWVQERRVLIGNRELMINHSVAVPKQSYEEKYEEQGSRVVYLATGGELCAAFIVEFTTEKTVMDVVRLLDKNDIVAIVRTMDSCVTADMLASLFKCDSLRFKILPSRLHPEYSRQLEPKKRLDSMLGNNGSLFGYIVSLAAAKKLHRCIRLGMVLYGISAVCGIVLMAVMLFLGKLDSFGCGQALIFMALFAFVYWLYEKNMHL